MAVCLSLQLHWITQLSLHGFSLNLICIFQKSLKKFKFHWSLRRITGTLHDNMYICDSISLTHFLEWEIFQTEVIEKIKTHFMFNNFFRKSCRSWDNVEKYGRARQTTNYNMIHSVCFACWIIKATDTHSEYVMFRATVVTWMCLSVTFICTLPVVLNGRVDLTCSDHCALMG